MSAFKHASHCASCRALAPACWLVLAIGVSASAQETVRIAPTRSVLVTEFARGLADFDEAQRELARRPDSARQLFRSAAQRFSSITAAGVVSGRLEFNLGNALLQAGDVGKAILHYKRAERLIPGDPLLRANLSLARSRCLTRIRPAPHSRFLHSVLFLHFDTTRLARVRLAAVAYFGFWLLLIGLRLSPRSTGGFRRYLGAGAAVCALAAASVAASVYVSVWTDRHRPAGVVTAMDVAVHKGPGSGYQRLFEQPLQPGVEFARIEERGQWINIELPDRQRGWIESSAAGLIPLQHE